MIWISLAFAGTCDKLDDVAKQTITAYLEVGVQQIYDGGQPENKYVSKARKLDAQGKLCSPRDKFLAASLLQTGFNVGQTTRAYELANEAMASHEPGAIKLVPYTYDRMRAAMGQHQRYATLVGFENGRQCLFPIEDTPAPDAERKSFGLVPLRKRIGAFGASIGLTVPVSTFAELGSSAAVCHGVGGGKRVKRQK